MRVAALEDNVAFLEHWCEEQQDTLDRTLGRAGPVGCDYEVESGPEATPRALLRVVDLRDAVESSDSGDTGNDTTIVAVVETDHERRVRHIRAQLNRLRLRLAASLTPPPPRPLAPTAESPAPRPSAPRRVSAKPAGRTAP